MDMAHTCLLVLLLAASVHSAVIRTLILRGVHNKGAAPEGRDAAEDSSIDHATAHRHAGFESRSIVASHGGYKLRERRGTPPWIKGRYGRTMGRYNPQRFGHKTEDDFLTENSRREALERKVRSMILNKKRTTADGFGHRFNRQVWLKQRYGRERGSRGVRASADSNSRFEFYGGNRANRGYYLRERAAPGWHHGRYGRNMLHNRHLRGNTKRHGPVWFKGRYAGREVEDGVENENELDLREINEDAMDENDRADENMAYSSRREEEEDRSEYENETS